MIKNDQIRWSDKWCQTDAKNIYEFEGKTRRYYPDLYLPGEKKIIEVK